LLQLHDSTELCQRCTSMFNGPNTKNTLDRKIQKRYG